MGTVPSSVSLVSKPCENAENNVKVLNTQPADGVKKRFGVCAKQFTYENRDFTVRFIEWVHISRLLGAEKVHFFYKFLHPDMFKVVKYMEQQGFIEAWPFFEPTGRWHKRLMEVNSLTDCFYRVKNLYDYVAIYDFDEIILPMNEKDMSWDDMIKRLEHEGRFDAYVSQNMYYPEVGAEPLPGIPTYMYMLQHTQKPKNYSEAGRRKSIFNTETVLTAFNHFPTYCLGEKYKCNSLIAPTNISQNCHYREGLSEYNSTNQTVLDDSILKFKDPLIKAVQETLKATKFRL